jgi:hypothetical protein
MSTPTRDYRRVSADEQSASLATPSAPAAGTSDRLDAELQPSSNTPSFPPRTFTERLTDKLVAAAWVTVAALVSFWTDTVNVLLHPNSSEAIAALLQLAAVGVGINTVLVFYLTVYLPYGKGLTDSTAWPVYCPRVIPSITITSVLIAICLIRATWPVWGIFAPLILGVQALGLLFSLHFIPIL